MPDRRTIGGKIFAPGGGPQCIHSPRGKVPATGMGPRSQTRRDSLSKPSTISFENLLRAGARLTGGEQPDRVEDALPLRAELFSAEQMEQHGRALAAMHKLSTRRMSD